MSDLLWDRDNPRAQALQARLAEHAARAPLPEDMAVVLGGDGFMLRMLREAPPSIRCLVGLNCGTLGFLLNGIPEGLGAFWDRLRAGDLHRMQLPRLRMTGVDVRGREVTADAFNDIYLERMSGQTAQLQLELNSTMVVEKVVCDGLIFSTPIGSTAYNFSAGGVACHPQLSLINITAICPHIPRLPPLAVRPDAVIEVRSLSPHKRPVRAVADGVDHDEIVSLRVTMSPSTRALGLLQADDFTRKLVAKLLHP